MADDKETKKSLWESDFPDEEESAEESRMRRQWELQQAMIAAQREKRFREQKRRAQAIILLGLIASGLIIGAVILTVRVFIPTAKYNAVHSALAKEDYALALEALKELDDYCTQWDKNYSGEYKDSAKLRDEAIRGYAIALSGKEDAYYATSATAPWFSFDADEPGYLKFDKKKYRGDGHIVIPDVFDNVLVVGLAKNGFFYCDEVLSITFSECIVNIGMQAFLGCDGLTEITLPRGLRVIEESAFKKCKSLARVNFGDSLVYLGQGAFAECASLKEVVLPDSLEELSPRAFNVCAALEKISIPGGIKTVGGYVLASCPKLQTVEFRGSEDKWKALNLNYNVVGIGENTKVVFTQ